MRPHCMPKILIAIVLALNGALHAAPVTFCATGDGPRSPEEFTLIAGWFAAPNLLSGCAFLLHTGDLCAGSTHFDRAYSDSVEALYRQSPLPVVFVVGDNEWNDQENPAEGWENWSRGFLNFDRHFPQGPKPARQPERPENLAWMTDRVLFIGLNLVGGNVHDASEWRLRHGQNLAWVKQQLDGAPAARAAVVFAQAKPTDKHADFFPAFIKCVREWKKPVMYLHGDGHKWQWEPGWKAPNLTRVQVDQVSKAPPVHITVGDEGAPQFVFDRKLYPNQ